MTLQRWYWYQSPLLLFFCVLWDRSLASWPQPAFSHPGPVGNTFPCCPLQVIKFPPMSGKIMIHFQDTLLTPSIQLPLVSSSLGLAWMITYGNKCQFKVRPEFVKNWDTIPDDPGTVFARKKDVFLFKSLMFEVSLRSVVPNHRRAHTHTPSLLTLNTYPKLPR